MEALLNILSELHPEVDFETCTTLIDDKILDSFDIVTIVAEIDSEYDVAIPAEELLPENFNSAKAFVQNPLNDLYPELIYRTGDLGRLNARGELEFAGRKDFQIKHMGHRIELGEIEVITNMHDAVKTACCIFDNVKKKIILYYVGDITPGDMSNYIKGKLPRYMVPNVVRQLDMLPLTPNGKIDRNRLKTLYEEK